MSERKLEVKSVETLLNKSGELIKADLALRKEKGEDFNIFSILGMDNNEAKTHSAMLSALLNPIGNHYQNEKFLELFLKEINYDYQKEDLKKVKVQAEHYLGKISKDYLSGGFIDLLISFPSGKAIVIENKIKAGDQPKQMYRYSLYKEK
ncbi:MAG: PD-(D/E)XK nuclease family protein, partial [Flavobacteriales bacterium]